MSPLMVLRVHIWGVIRSCAGAGLGTRVTLLTFGARLDTCHCLDQHFTHLHRIWRGVGGLYECVLWWTQFMPSTLTPVTFNP